MTQYGFFVDLSRCIGCNTCTIACKQWHNLDPGPIKWMRVYQWEEGSYPETRIRLLPIMCYHCENPVCAKACPNQAIAKDEKYGVVLVNAEKCQGTRKCWKACPYGSPQFAGDAPGTKMSKCNMCVDRLEQGLKPICVLSCSMRALEFGTIEELKKKYGELKAVAGMPRPNITGPAIVFRPADLKKQVVPWDSRRVLELWQKRQPHEGKPLPDLFTETSEVTRPQSEGVGRHKLVLKAKNSEELMYYTTDDE